MSGADIKLSLRDHFKVCAVAIMGASAGFAFSGGNDFIAVLVGLYSAGLARSYTESKLSGLFDYERPTIWNIRSYLRDAPRSGAKRFNDAAVVCLATLAGGAAGSVLGCEMGIQTGLLAVPFAAAAGAGGGGFAGWIAGHILRHPTMGAVSLVEATWSGLGYVANRKPAPGPTMRRTNIGGCYRTHENS